MSIFIVKKSFFNTKLYHVKGTVFKKPAKNFIFIPFDHCKKNPYRRSNFQLNGFLASLRQPQWKFALAKLFLSLNYLVFLTIFHAYMFTLFHHKVCSFIIDRVN